MLDIKFIRENPNVVEKAAKDKGIDIDINHVLEIDKKYRELSLSVQKLQEERNRLAKAKDIEEGKKIKDQLGKQEYALRALEEERKGWLLKIPNLALGNVPVGDKSKNQVIKTYGEPTVFSAKGFTPKDHLKIGEYLDIIDVERAAKVSGTRFGYLKNEGALLEFALINFALDTLIKEGFIPVVPPALIKKEITDELGYWHGKLDEKHTGNENYYLVYDPKEEDPSENPEAYLIGTAEHAIVPMHKDEVFNAKDLPKKYVAFSPSFRREAGTYGKDTRGIFRVHQFDKVEMVAFVKPEDDEEERRKLLSISETFMQELSLPYQLVKLASLDLAFPSAEAVDIETWIPSQNKYRETHSISTTTDFQARRLNIKYSVEQNKKEYVHILNGTAFAIGRTIIAILENYQQKDGSVVIPKVLQKYLNKEKIIPKK